MYVCQVKVNDCNTIGNFQPPCINQLFYTVEVTKFDLISYSKYSVQ